MEDKKTFSILYKTDNEYIVKQNKENVALIKKEFEKIGYKIRIVDIGDNTEMVYFSQTTEYEKKYKRNAGRKKKVSKSNVRLSEVRKELEKATAEEVAKKYGVSRSTLFRRIKEAETYNEDFYIF